MMRIVYVVASGSQQLHRLSNPLGLVDRALLADGQMHGQMQERVALAVVKLAA